MSLTEVLLLLSGVALFLFGMTLMGDGLKMASGSKLEPILFRLSGTTLRGILLGTGVTAVIQSSCATSVMAVGFVNAGMMKVRQAVGIILGAILGTSITGWVICLSYIEGGAGWGALLSTATLTGGVAVIGIILRMFSRKQTSRFIGDILMGFAVLMLGMSTMSDAVSSLGEKPWFTDMLTSMTNPLLGILIGTVFTALLQSASAAVGILQALSVTGAMPFSAALPLLMGVTVGASFPVLLSALGANTEGKRTAMVYLTASTAGVIVSAALFYAADALFHFPFTAAVMDPFSMAAVNSVLRLVMLLVLVPFTKTLEAAVTRMVPDRAPPAGEEEPSLALEERFLAYPALAVEQSRIVMNAMAEKALRAVEEATALLNGFRPEGFAAVESLEAEGDRYEDALGSYLIKITGRELTDEQNRQITVFLHTLTDFERITDHALNIAQSAQELHENNLAFSEDAKRELAVVIEALLEVIRMAVDAFVENDSEAAQRVEPLEEVIDGLCSEVKRRHVERLQQGRCTIRNGFVLNDLVTNFERVSDHCSNIAVALIELQHASFETHDYVNLVRRKDGDFDRVFRDYLSKYTLA